MAKKILIKRGGNQQLAPNFNESEFYSTSPNAPAEHPFYSELVAAVQFLRTYYGVPWRITSTYRTTPHELRLAREMGRGEAYAQALSRTSQHVLGRAVDSQPVENHAEIVADLDWQFNNRGPVFLELLKIGITGFGIYEWGIHLDVRQNPTKKPLGVYSFWDDRAAVGKKKALTTTIPNQTKTPASLPKKAGPSS